MGRSRSLQNRSCIDGGRWVLRLCIWCLGVRYLRVRCGDERERWVVG